MDLRILKLEEVCDPKICIAQIQLGSATRDVF